MLIVPSSATGTPLVSIGIATILGENDPTSFVCARSPPPAVILETRNNLSRDLVHLRHDSRLDGYKAQWCGNSTSELMIAGSPILRASCHLS